MSLLAAPWIGRRARRFSIRSGTRKNAPYGVVAGRKMSFVGTLLRARSGRWWAECLLALKFRIRRAVLMRKRLYSIGARLQFQIDVRSYVGNQGISGPVLLMLSFADPDPSGRLAT